MVYALEQVHVRAPYPPHLRVKSVGPPTEMAQSTLRWAASHRAGPAADSPKAITGPDLWIWAATAR